MSTNAEQPNAPELPGFGGDNGLIYPLIARVLERCTRFTVPRCRNLSSTATDAYILVCVLLGAVASVTADAVPEGCWVLWIILIFVGWRLFELSSVTLFEFCVGSYRGRSTKPLSRVVSLKLINLMEVIVLFGLCYFLPGKHGCRWMNQGFGSVFDAIYFSTVTAGTLGYGDYSPTHWLLNALVMVELLFFVLIGLSILSVLRSRAPLLPGDPPR